MILLEASDAQSRLKWLQTLQDRRRAWVKHVSTPNESGAVALGTLPDLSHFMSANYSAVDDSSSSSSTATDVEQQNSVFYLNEKGELNDKSFSVENSCDDDKGDVALIDSAKSHVQLRKKSKYIKKNSRIFDEF